MRETFVRDLRGEFFDGIDKRGKDAARGCFCTFRPAATSKDSGFSSVQG